MGGFRTRTGHWPARRWSAAAFALACAGFAAFAAGGARAQSVESLQQMSIEQLADVDVTSVYKRSAPVSDAPAAIYVITHDEIMRSGARTLPDILRLAPNLQIAMITGSEYAITARGFNGNAADKLLVMIDGRSVYSPLFGGVFWDEIDVQPEDIERIEVISGPGATLWGANAVNGVINIITRSAEETHGGSMAADVGNRGYDGSAEFGGKISDSVALRVFADGLEQRADKTTQDLDAFDGWSREHGGFRLDWTPGADAVTVTGDLYHADEQQAASGPNLDVLGAHLQAQWTHNLTDDSMVQVLGYYQESQRYSEGVGYWLNTYDLEAQNTIQWGSRQQIVWGLGGRIYQDHFDNAQPVQYLPASSTEGLGDLFGQDTISLTSRLNLTLGLKLEKDPYAGVAPLPNVRLAFKPDTDTLLWAAISRAVRAPTIFDEDLVDTVVPGVVVIKGNPDFQPEKLTAYEVGARRQFGQMFSVSVSGYYDVYEDLRSVELAPTAPPPLVIEWGNNMFGDVYGVEAWANLQPTSWWRLSAGGDLMHESLRYQPGASAFNTLADAGDDPNTQASVRSTINIGPKLSWMADLRYVDTLPNPHIPSYVEADTSLTFAVNPHLDLVFRGANLLHGHHLEYEEAGATIGDLVERSFSIGARARF